MTAVMEGVRVLEVAEHTFVPAASALLSDWGAEVIKIEHVERGDAMRGLASTGMALVPNDVHVLLEHSNRGKKSLGARPGLSGRARSPGQARSHLRRVPHQQTPQCAAQAPDRRRGHPGLQPEHHLHARHRPGRTGARRRQGLLRLAGVLGPLRRGRRSPAPRIRPRARPPAPGFGDSIGAMTIAGGIMGALFHRERTGEAHRRRRLFVGVGLWAMGQALGLSLLLERPWAPPAADAIGANPLSRTYATKDGRVLSFTCLQAGEYWPTLCRCHRTAGVGLRPPLRRSWRRSWPTAPPPERFSTRSSPPPPWPSGERGLPPSRTVGRGPEHAGGGG